MMQNNPMEEKLDLADDLLKQGKYGKAIALLENMHAEHPREESVLLRLAWASWDNGEKEHAIG
jgi:outer membrane protein assembly factor BamD (BamD/ComL family)